MSIKRNRIELSEDVVDVIDHIASVTNISRSDIVKHVFDRYKNRINPDMIYLRDERMYEGIKQIYYRNTSAVDKKAVTVEFEINPEYPDIYVERKSGYMNVLGFIDPETKLFVVDRLTDAGYVCAADEFAKTIWKSLDYDSDKYCERLSNMDADTVRRNGIKAPHLIIDDVMNYISTNGYLRNIQQQLALLPSRPLPLYNTKLLYSDYLERGEITQLSTTVLPYRNPAHLELTKEQFTMVDSFFDVFFDESDKLAFTWYFGGILSNEPVFSEHIQKLLVVTSPHGGTGKSTMIGALSDALLTPDYYEQFAEFDTHFKSDNKFATSAIGNKRLSLYHEAKWCITSKEAKNDFEGMDDAIIRSLLTEGVLSVEEKYAKRSTRRTPGMHIVLSNTLPMLTNKTQALARRLLVITIKPTHMIEKAKQLGLTGYDKFKQFIVDNREIFAAYLYHQYARQKKNYMMFEYDSESTMERIMDTENEALRMKTTSEALLRAKHPVLALGEILSSLQVSDYKQKKMLGELQSGSEDIFFENNAVWVNCTKQFLNRFGNGARIRNMLKRIYGSSVQKGKQRYLVMEQQDFELPGIMYMFPNNVRQALKDVIIEDVKNPNIRIIDGKAYIHIDECETKIRLPIVRKFGAKFYEVPLIEITE